MPKSIANPANPAAPAPAAPVVRAGTISVEVLNIGLMLVALLFASIVPFELFLISYAVLGPLHYLTELSWLHDRQYFAPRKTDWLPLLIFAILITLGNANVVGASGMDWLDSIALGETSLASFFQAVYPDVTFIAFAAALIFITTTDFKLRLFGLLLASICAWLFHAGAPTRGPGLYYKLFGVYLPTLIHVFVFTGAFILAGALKRRSIAGYVSFAAFLACAALAIWMPNFASASSTAAPAIFWRGFQELSLSSLNDLMHYPTRSLDGLNVFSSDLVLRLVRFLAFAYTYHYLNWFSKTSIIQWHAVPRSRLTVILIAWLASVGLYAVNYDLGLRWLFLLSLTHVLLEFPLNHKSFLDIATELRRRLFPLV